MFHQAFHQRLCCFAKILKRIIRSASIAIFLRTERIKKNGDVPIYLRFTLNRKKVEISLKRFLSTKVPISVEKIKSLKPSERLHYYNWNPVKEKLTKGADNYDRINYFLAKEKNP